MGIFSNIKSDGLEETKDYLGGRSVLNTNIYDGEIVMAYAGKSQKGAQFVHLEVAIEGRPNYTETFYVTNQKGENFFIKDNNKIGLPGFVIIDELCLCTTEKPLSDQDTEEKVVKIYNFTEKKEVPTSVPVLIDLLGKKTTLAIYKNLEDITEKADNGDYVPTGKTKETNNVEKVFESNSRLTVPEARSGIESPEFYDAWLEKNKDNVKDKTKKDNIKNGRPAGAPPAAQGGAQSSGRSLFGKK